MAMLNWLIAGGTCEWCPQPTKKPPNLSVSPRKGKKTGVGAQKNTVGLHFFLVSKQFLSSLSSNLQQSTCRVLTLWKYNWINNWIKNSFPCQTIKFGTPNTPTKPFQGLAAASLQTHQHDSFLSLKADVLGPFHEAGQVTLGLNVTTQTIIPRSLLEQRIPGASMNTKIREFNKHHGGWKGQWTNPSTLPFSHVEPDSEFFGLCGLTRTNPSYIHSSVW